MQGHRDQRVGFREKLAPGLADPATHHWRKIKPIAIFERVHQGARYFIKPNGGARAVISRRIGDRLHRQYARSGIVDEGRAEPLAIGSRDEGQFRPARRTDAAAFDLLAAGWAQRRERQIEDVAQSRMSGSGGAPEGSRQNIAVRQHDSGTLPILAANVIAAAWGHMLPNMRQ